LLKWSPSDPLSLSPLAKSGTFKQHDMMDQGKSKPLANLIQLQPGFIPAKGSLHVMTDMKHKLDDTDLLPLKKMKQMQISSVSQQSNTLNPKKPSVTQTNKKTKARHCHWICQVD
jgi:hypothetical protein